MFYAAIDGAPGAGKSRLSAELADQATILPVSMEPDWLARRKADGRASIEEAFRWYFNAERIRRRRLEQLDESGVELVLGDRSVVTLLAFLYAECQIAGSMGFFETARKAVARADWVYLPDLLIVFKQDVSLSLERIEKPAGRRAVGPWHNPEFLAAFNGYFEDELCADFPTLAVKTLDTGTLSLGKARKRVFDIIALAKCGSQVQPGARSRATKIIATIGRGSHEVDTMAEIIQAGASCLRFNLGTDFPHQIMLDRMRNARRIAAEVAPERVISFVCDVSFPHEKIRLGAFEPAIELVAGDHVCLAPWSRVDATPPVLPVSTDLATLAASEGDQFIIGDGEVLLRVVSVAADWIELEALAAGTIIERKGIARMGGAAMLGGPAPNLVELLPALAELKPEVLALSFAQTAEHIHAARRMWADLAKSDWTPRFVAKIETRAGVDNVAEIAHVADGIMLARGDLSLALPPDELAAAHAAMLRDLRDCPTEVIVATHVMPSIVKSAIPAANDCLSLYRLVEDQVDSVMLTRETSNSIAPPHSVAVVKSVIDRAMKDRAGRAKRVAPR